jgi:transmembrane sensor
MSGRSTFNAAKALDNHHAEQAIEWMVLFRSGEATPDDYQRFSVWSAADPRNAQIWERMQGVMQRSFAPIREVNSRAPGQTGAVERALSNSMLRPGSSNAPARRKLLRGALVFAAAGVATGVMFNRSMPLAALRADLHTGTGERKHFTLPDGSTLVLNARSAVDIDFSAGLRRVRLMEGELIATVAADAARPFVIETEHGSARALGTRFLVRREEQQSLALVLEHSILVRNGGQELALQTGEAAYFNAAAITRVAGDVSTRAAWADGMLVAHDETLAQVIDALRPYRKGYIRVSPAAAKLRVLGAFPLDDTDNLLRSLEQTMPISVRNFGNLLVMIDVQ